MAQSAQSVLDVQAGGSDSSGGGFSLAGNTYAITDLNATGSSGNTTTPTVNSTANYTFTANDVGLLLYVASGTNWLPGLYPITAVNTGTNVATLGQPWPQVGTFAGCASTASPTGGSATICRIPKTAAWTNGTNLTVDATTNTKVNPDGYTVTNADVGNWIQITTTGGGAAFTTGFYQITAVTTGGSQRWTLDRSPAATSSAGATWAMGGSLATWSKAGGASVASNRIFIQSGAYSSTATNTFAATSVNPSNSTPANRITGYSTLWGDIRPTGPGAWANNASRPVLTISTNSGLTAVNLTNGGWVVENLVVNCAGLATGIKVNGARCAVINCQVLNPNAVVGIWLANSLNAVLYSEVTGCTSSSGTGIRLGGNPTLALHCHVHDNTAGSFIAINAGNNQGNVHFCLAANNSGAGSVGIAGGSSNTNSTDFLNNTVFNSGSDGMQISYDGAWVVKNNILAKNGGYGIKNANGAGSPAIYSYDGNTFWANATGTRNQVDDGAAGGSSVTNPVNLAGAYVNVLDVAISGTYPTNNPFVRATTPVADLTVDGSNNIKVTSSSYNFAASDVGATIYVTNQTGGWTMGQYTIASVASNAAILTASPGTVGSTSGSWYFNDFRLNNTASAGALARAAGTPGALPGVSQVGSIDMGVFQHPGNQTPLIFGA